MAGHLNGAETLVKATHPEALFIHCYEHDLHPVLSQSLSQIPECKLLSSTLMGLAEFFSRVPKRAKSLTNFCAVDFHRYGQRDGIFSQSSSTRFVGTEFNYVMHSLQCWSIPKKLRYFCPCKWFLSVLEDFQFLLFILNILANSSRNPSECVHETRIYC
jgi:hypothetical protein